MTITQVITALPPAPNPLTDTPAVFSEKAAASVAAQQGLPPEINAWRVQANALEANVNAKESAASAAKTAAETARDAALGYKNTAQLAADASMSYRDQAQSWAGAAAGSAATASSIVAFVDTNSIAKGSIDASKQVRFECDALIPPGTVIPLTVPAAGGTLALLSDLQELTRAMTFYDNGTSTAVAYANGGTQRVAPASGAKTMSFTGWPASGKQAVQFLELVNIALGGNPAWPAGARFIRYDGVIQTTAAAANITWQTGGTDYVMVSTRDGGTTLIVSVLRG
ncbi:hypothetical protein CR152_31935 [Massilia violaceinigra]|uniref:Uncharacterized protein n=1 Tax=Massilia violaceinigra TaxID=2045208 RepID=A0A2D2DUH8_9BURK|nr:hypothetical protein [Massilia violaceinigra]ATQ75094.1 hypothetical protein CR152_11590 [Massilia violaceinigra]ATQ78616.1 hypothetical protein CR152_31935 [Massilia violaceinigra]